MNSTFMGLEIGKRGLMAHQQALNVTSHNISNADNKEYSRQRVVIKSADPLYVPALNREERAGNIGQGAVVSSVERIRDSFIDDRIVAEKNSLGYWKTKDGLINQIEKIYNEPSDMSIRSRMDGLWKAWQELSKYPEERSTREVVKEKAVNLSHEINSTFRQLADLRKNVESQIKQRVHEINIVGKSIRNLNERIVKSIAIGDNPNDLQDKRDALIEKLSKMIDVSVSRSDKDEIMVYIGSENFIQGEVFRPIEAKADKTNDGLSKIVWSQTGTDVKFKGGDLAGLVEVRDKILMENINDLNSLSINLADMTNEIHRNGFSKRNETNMNFFKVLNISDNVQGNFDLNNDGINDTSAIFRVSGNNKVDPSAVIGINGTLTFVKNDKMNSEVKIDYKATDTINNVIKRINDSNSGIVAYVNYNKRIAFKATIAQDSYKKNFMIRHMEDSGQLLVGLTGVLKQNGPQGAFDYRRVNDIMKFLPSKENVVITPKFNPASYLSVSDEVISNVDNIAASGGKDVGGTGDVNKSNGNGDGTNALRLAKLRYDKGMVDKNATFNEFYTSLISRIGTQGEESNDRLTNQNTLLKNLLNLRESVSGVNLDEEMANMVAFQHGYNAAARVITTMDRMLDVIINRMGV